ncbi:MAG: hypothetical protein F4082_04845, partial [Gammaproteobacteria bacterium]|nr:hypothetical protein [Gammaproteobacteria bacterium]
MKDFDLFAESRVSATRGLHRLFSPFIQRKPSRRVDRRWPRVLALCLFGGLLLPISDGGGPAHAQQAKQVITVELEKGDVVEGDSGTVQNKLIIKLTPNPGDSRNLQVFFRVYRSGAAANNTDMDFTTQSLSDWFGNQYVRGAALIVQGEKYVHHVKTGQTVTIPLKFKGDKTIESDEDFNVRFQLNDKIGAHGSVTIESSDNLSKSRSFKLLNDDTEVKMKVEDGKQDSAFEGHSGKRGAVAFEAYLDPKLNTKAFPQSISFTSCLAGDADSTSDYTYTPAGTTQDPTCGSFSITDSTSQKVKTHTFQVNGDIELEGSETIEASVSAVTTPTTGGVRLDTDAAVYTIKTDDATLSIAAPPDDNDRNLSGGFNDRTFTVSLSDPIDVNVNYSICYSGTATRGFVQNWAAGTDYQVRFNDIVITTRCIGGAIIAGTSTQTQDIRVYHDLRVERDETVTAKALLVSNPDNPRPKGITVINNIATHTIKNIDEGLVSISSPKNALEGQSGTTDRQFTLSLLNESAVDFGTYIPVVTEFDIPYQLCFTGTAKIDASGGSSIAAGADYQPLSNGAPVLNNCINGSIPPGASSATAGIRVRGDTEAEDHETVTVTLLPVGTWPSSVSLLEQFVSGSSVATHTILDDDVTASFADTQSSAGEADASRSVTVNLNPAPLRDFSLSYTVGGTAKAGSDGDFTIRNSGTVKVKANATQAIIPVSLINDSIVEGEESVILTLMEGKTFSLGASKRHVLTITDDDSATLSISAPADAVEGNSGTTDRIFTVTVSAPVAKPIYYRVCFSGTAAIDLTQAATIAGDYQPLFTADGQQQTGSSRCVGAAIAGSFDTLENQGVYVQYGPSIGVRVRGDRDIEVDETVIATLEFVGAAPSGATLDTAQATHTIVDDDRTLASISAPADADEGDAGTTTRSFTVSLSKPTSNHITFDVCFSGTASIDLTQAGTIPAAADYQPLANGSPAGASCVSGTVGALSTSATVDVRVRGDQAIEGNETVTATLSISGTVPTGFALGTEQATHVILEDDVQVSFAAAADLALEGSGNHEVAVNISPAAAADFSFNYTVGGTATAGVDFTVANSGSVAVSKGDTNAVIAVALPDNDVVESSKTLVLTLADVFHSATGKSTHRLTIVNNDIEVTMGMASRSEGDSDFTSATDIAFIVARPPETPGFRYDLCLNGSATLDKGGDQDGSGTESGEDYQLVDYSGSVRGLNSDGCLKDIHSTRFSSGNPVHEQRWGLRINDDALPESSETIIVTVTASATQPANVPTGDWSFPGSPAIHTIVDDLSDLPVPEEELILTLHAPQDRYEDDTSDTSTTGSFRVSASRPFSGSFNVKVCLSGTAKQSVAVDGAGYDASKFADTDDYGLVVDRSAEAGAEGTALNCYTRFVVAGQSASPYVDSNASTDFTLIIKGDSTIEIDETVNATLGRVDDGSAPTPDYVKFGSTPATYTILNDDSAASFAVDKSEAVESAGLQTVVVKFAPALQKNVTVRYRLAAGSSAERGEDFEIADFGELAVKKGATEAVIPIALRDDYEYEGSEDLTLVLRTGSSGYVRGDARRHTMTIQDNDSVTLSVRPPIDAYEGNSGTTDRTFTVQSSAPLISSVDYRVCFSGSAAIDLTKADPMPAGTDYQPLEGGAPGSQSCVDGTMAAKASSAQVTIRVRGDTDGNEGDETVDATLSLTGTVPAGVALDAATATHTIVDDDDQSTAVVSIRAPPGEYEGDSGTRDRYFEVRSTAPATVDAHYRVCFSGNASIDKTQANPMPAGADYQPMYSSLPWHRDCVSGHIEKGSTSGLYRIGIRVRGDTEVEGDETVVATLSESRVVGQEFQFPSDMSLDTTPVTYTIIADERRASFAAAASRIYEGDGTHRVAVRLEPAPTQDVALSYTVGGSAQSGDYSIAGAGTVVAKAGAKEAAIEIAVADDAVVESDSTVVLTLTGSGGGYALGGVLSHEVTIVDDDQPRIVIDPALNVSEGGSADYAVSLGRRPSGDVKVSISGHSKTGLTLSTVALNFSMLNWRTPQTVTVQAGEDDDALDDMVTLTHTASGGGYKSVNGAIGVTVTDNDEAGLVFNSPPRLWEEGSTANHTVRLATRPSSDVRISIATESGSDVTLSPS